MKRCIYTIYMIAAALSLSPLSAQQIMEGQAEVKNLAIVRDGSRITVNMDVDVSNLKVGADEIIIFTPTLSKGEQEFELPAIEIMGRRSNIYHKRNDELTITSNPYYAERTAKRAERKQGPQIISYSASTTLEQWMRDAEVILKQGSCGCSNTPLALGDETLKDRLLPPPHNPQYILALVEPEPEPVKIREEAFSAYINFIVNRHEILESFKNNASELAGVLASISKVEQDEDLTIESISINGWASPEAKEDYNKALSERRANSLANYIAKNSHIERSHIVATGCGEDWAGLRKMVVESDKVAKQNEVLAIIDDTTLSLDEKDARLRAMIPASIYNHLFGELYPSLRRNDYRIEYKVRNFDLNEARQLIKTNPKKLSLHEMYKVAGSYDKDSAEYHETMNILANTYPEIVAAAVDMAAMQISDGNYDAALATLAKSDQNDSHILNTQGYAYAKKGDFDNAARVWQRAADMGNADAKHNLDEMNKYLKSIK